MLEYKQTLTSFFFSYENETFFDVFKTYLETPINEIMIPATKRIISKAHNIPPQAVKSIFVWKANKVNPKVTPQVMPTAIKTASASNLAAKEPNMNPSAAVNMPKKMMLVGNFRRTPSQQAMAMMQTKVMTMEIQ